MSDAVDNCSPTAQFSSALNLNFTNNNNNNDGHSEVQCTADVHFEAQETACFRRIVIPNNFCSKNGSTCARNESGMTSSGSRNEASCRERTSSAGTDDNDDDHRDIFVQRCGGGDVTAALETRQHDHSSLSVGTGTGSGDLFRTCCDDDDDEDEEDESPDMAGCACSVLSTNAADVGGVGSASNQDDGESGRFTEQESVDFANESAPSTEDVDREEPDSENEVIEHLRAELEKAKKELRVKNEKCEKLSEMQNIVDAEIHELTASLFQEAYKMVADANQRRHLAEKLYKEAAGKVDVLQAEVEALKTLVLTSTPSAPNRHLHPQLIASSSNASCTIKKPPLGFFSPRNNSTSGGPSSSSIASSFLGHKRNHSDTVTSSHCHTGGTSNNSSTTVTTTTAVSPCHEQKETREIDPNYYRDFTSWREKMDPTDKSHSFLQRIYREDIMPCLKFVDDELSTHILTSIENNTLVMERVTEEKPVARTCSLLLMPCTCNYRLKLDNNSDWLYISALCRNRIVAICDFLTYLRYMQQGLVKCSLIECYWEIIRLRKNIAQARLGLGVGHHH